MGKSWLYMRACSMCAFSTARCTGTVWLLSQLLASCHSCLPNHRNSLKQLAGTENQHAGNMHCKISAGAGGTVSLKVLVLSPSLFLNVT